MRTFIQVLVNTALANVTTSFLWFALTFWVYIETQSVLATGIIGGAYMLFVAIFSMVFGTIVDRHRKHGDGVLEPGHPASFLIAGALYLAQPESALLDIGGPWFWLFSGIILFGGVIENMRNIALSTTVTLLVPVERHANANGLVGTVQGIAFIVTSVFSGLAIGFLGMGWTLADRDRLHARRTCAPLVPPHPRGRSRSARASGSPSSTSAAASARSRVGPGLFALIIFSTFNNLIGGVYMALMDPYGLTLFPVEWWGIVLGVTSTGFIIGGIVIAKRGLGAQPDPHDAPRRRRDGHPRRLFTIREWWWLYAVGIWIYMA